MPTADAVLDLLADPSRPPLPWPTAVVVAHPDDETIGIGGQLDRFADVVLVHVTDGSPEDPGDARAKGFWTREGYAAARRTELEAAAAVAGITDPDRLVGLGLVDQTAADDLAGLTRRLVALFAARETAVVITHVYEGGHPDHDATAFAVHAACRLVAPAPVVIEMPFYHLGAEGMVAHRFADPAGERVVPLDADTQARKRAMLAAHRTQAAVLAAFQDVGAERFRAAAAPDFSALPNGGRLHYERFPWRLDGPRWLSLAADATRELGVPPWR